MLVVLCAERDCDFSFGFIMAAHKVVLFFLLLCYLFPLYSFTITQQREANQKTQWILFAPSSLKGLKYAARNPTGI